MAPRTIRIVCIVSVLLNIFLIAAATGGAAWLRARHPIITAGSIRVAGAELPPAERRAFHMALRETRQGLRPLAIADHQAREDAAALLRAPMLDQPALGAALARIRAADIAIRTALEARAVSFAATLPPADRALLADGVVRRPRARRP